MNHLRAACVALSLIVLAQSAAADEAAKASITMELRRADTAIEHVDGHRLAGKVEGTVTIEGRSNPTACVGHAHVTSAAFHATIWCTMTAADGDRLFMMLERSGDGVIEDGGEGTLTIQGGTGKYAGMEHACPYVASHLPDRRMLVEAACNW